VSLGRWPVLALLALSLGLALGLLWVHAELWLTLRTAVAEATLRAGLWRSFGLGVVLLLAWLGLALLLLWHWLRPWRAVLAQAQALEQGQLLTAPEPRGSAPGQVVRSLNALVLRLRQGFDAQAQQVALLQRQAQADPGTGLPRREQFLVRLKEALADPGAPPASLLLVRVQRLDNINDRLGHGDTNRLLCAVADMLGTYLARVPGSFAGRLNGSDFALCLPAPGVAGETGESLLAALKALPLGRMAAAEWALGALDGVGGGTSPALRSAHAAAAGQAAAERLLSGVLAAADAALAEAEAQPASALVIGAWSGTDPGGARAWRTQISQALAEGRTRLAEAALCDASGQLLRLRCSLQVQLQPGGDFQAAKRWLALAARSRLLPQVDLAALDLALQAIARDGRARVVRVAVASLAAPAFAGLVQQRLQAATHAAGLVWLELSDELPRRLWPAVQAAVPLWRAAGARLALEHAGATPAALARWQGLGLEAVQVAGRHLQGLAEDTVVRDYASGLRVLVHGLGAQALALDMDDTQQLQVLWALGYDGAAGAALRPTPSPD